jgi:hypothetical protein
MSVNCKLALDRSALLRLASKRTVNSVEIYLSISLRSALLKSACKKLEVAAYSLREDGSYEFGASGINIADVNSVHDDGTFKGFCHFSSD